MFKLEMHLHVAETSPCAQTDEKTIAGIYSEAGYDGIVYTSHYNSFLSEYYFSGDVKKYNENFLSHFETLKAECAKRGVKVFFGMEAMPDMTSYYEETPDKAEFLIYGATPDFMRHSPERIFKMTVEELHDFCKKNGWILSQAHPFRPMISYHHPEFLDAAEVINDNPRQQNNNDLAIKYAKENNLIQTAGSDFHEPHDARAGVLLKNAVNSEKELVSELKKRVHEPFAF